ncbi:hypothetical protein Tco_0336970 [Tanacetum coccineum]
MASLLLTNFCIVNDKKIQSAGSKNSIVSELRDIDKRLDQNGPIDSLIFRRQDLMSNLNDLKEMEDMDFVQKAKVRWAIEGDENSKYFHGIINKKRSKSSHPCCGCGLFDGLVYNSQSAFVAGKTDLVWLISFFNEDRLPLYGIQVPLSWGYGGYGWDERHKAWVDDEEDGPSFVISLFAIVLGGGGFASCLRVQLVSTFLRWFDPPMCKRSVLIIPGLLRSRNELEEILVMVEEKRLKLTKFLIISWVAQREARLANELSYLSMQLVESVNERRAFIKELERLLRNLVAYKTREELKRLQKDDLIKVMEMRKVVLELRLQVHKEVDFYKTL